MRKKRNLTDSNKPIETSDLIELSLRVAKLPPIDNTNAEQLAARADEYFQMCLDAGVKPTLNGIASATGLDRRRLWEMRTDVPGRGTLYSHKCRDVVKRIYLTLENLWESYMQEGKINPVSGIFLGTNHFGYVSRQELSFGRPDALEVTATREELAERYGQNIVVDYDVRGPETLPEASSGAVEGLPLPAAKEPETGA